MATIPEDIKDLEKAKLEEIKLRHEIINLRDENLSNLEVLMKKRIVPIFLPLLTLTATSLFFIFNKCDSEKSKAFERYKSEVELVKMVWNDVKEEKDTFPHSEKFNKSIKFLVNVFSTNEEIYEEDVDLIGIEVDKRPIKLLTSVMPGLEKQIENEKLEKKILESSKKDIVEDVNKPVISQKEQTNLLIKNNNIDKELFTVYIQYSSEKDVEKVNKMINELKYDFIIPTAELIKQDAKKPVLFDNEVRYYSKFDFDKARELALKINQITGLSFQVKNIEHSKNSLKTLEIWFDNKNLNSAPSPTTDIPVIKNDSYDKVYEGNNYAAINYFNSITDDIDVFIDVFDKKNNEVGLRINDKKLKIKIGEYNNPPLLIDNKYRVTIKINGYQRNATIRKVVMYSILIEEKK